MTELFKLVGTLGIEGVDEAESDLRGVTATAESSGEKLISTFKKIGTAVAAAFAIDKIIDFGKEIVSTAATVAAEESAFLQIMGDFAEEASEKVGMIADATGMTDTRLTPYMTSMTAKFKGLGYEVDEATDFAARGLTLAADAAAFWDKSLDESMSHLNSFINGSYEGGEAIGLFANDTQMAAYAISKGIVAEAKAWAALDEATKQATRLEYAENMMKMSGATGQAAKESDQYANVQANLNEKWRQFKAMIGEPLLQNVVLPVMTKLIDVVDWASEAFEKCSEWVAENKDTIVEWTGYIIAAGVAVGTFLIYLNWGQIMSAAAAALNLVTSAISKMTTTMNKNPIGLVISLITSLIAYLIYLYNTNEEFRAFVDRMLSALWEKVKIVIAWIQENVIPVIRKIVNEVKAFLLPIIQQVSDWIQNTLLPSIKQLISWIQTNVMPIIQSIISWIQENVMPVIQSVVEWLGSTLGAFFTWISETIGAFFTWFIGIFQSTSDSTGGIWETIKGFFSSAWDFIVGIWNACKPFFEGVWNGVILPVAEMYEEMIGAFIMAWEVIKLVWEKCEPFFTYLWERLKIAVTTLWNLLVTGFETTWNIIKETLTILWTFLLTGFKNAWEGIKLIWNMVVPYFKAVWESIKAVFSVVVAVLGGFFKTAWEVIKAAWNIAISFFTMVWAGIKAVFAVVKGVLSGDFSDAWDAIKNYWDKVVNYFSAIWNGIKGIFGAVGSWFGNTFKAAWNAVKNVFSAWGSFFNSLWDNIKNTFSKIGTNIANAIGSSVKAGLNGVISSIEGIINSGVNMINGAISLINEIPGVNIGKLAKLSLPRLARGGIVDSPTVAQIGEDGAEAVVPLENNMGWLDNLLDKIAASREAQSAENINAQYFETIIDRLDIIIDAIHEGKTIKINEREFARTVREYA